MRRVKPIHLSRRALLRGAGVALGLPFLEAMLPQRARAQEMAVPPRFFAVYWPTGVQPPLWRLENSDQQGVYTDWQFREMAAALAPHQTDLTVITHLANEPAGVGNGGNGIHARGTGCFLLCEPLYQNGFEVGVSLDQLIAEQVSRESCIPSLALGVPNERPADFAEDGYGSVYYNNVSFTGPTSNVQKESNPLDLWNRLITCGSLGEAPMGGDPGLAQRRMFEAAVMDRVKDDATQLMQCVGQEDRLRLDQFFTSVSELEQRFMAEPVPSASECVIPAEPLEDAGSFRDNTRLMMDLSVFAFQCGLTRVQTLMLDGAFSRRDYGLPDIDGVDYIHGLSHGEISGSTQTDHPRWLKITIAMMEDLAYLVGRMKEINEGERSLLGNSIVFMCSEFGDGNGHSNRDLPVVVAGSGGGLLRNGIHIVADNDLPVANLFLSFLQGFGIERDSFGNSSGRLMEILA